MDRARFVFFLTGFILLASSLAMAQFPVLDAEQVKAWMEGGRKFVLLGGMPEWTGKGYPMRKGKQPGKLK